MNNDHAADNADIAPEEDAASGMTQNLETPGDHPTQLTGRAVDQFPVVGIGASAGGLAAFEAFLRHLPLDTGLAYVLVQHMAPDQESHLIDLLSRRTPLPVEVVEEEGTPVDPDHVYVIPPGRNLALFNGTLRLLDVSQQPGRLTVDHFFRSLAQDQGERAIGIVLSGTGSDGTLGVRAIKEAGGMVMAQEPDTADFDGMPQSAIETGLVDYVLPPNKMPQQIMSYVEHAASIHERIRAAYPGRSDWLQRVLVLLRTHTSYDFSGYKETVLQRRIAHRMALHRIVDGQDYVRYLQRDPAEVGRLFRALLISVSSFFRDPLAFEVLAQEVIPRLLERTADVPEVRIWVPGCATGEEAYSVAMLLVEEMERKGLEHPVKIFATDLDVEALRTARQGIYPASSLANVSPERLERFFGQLDDQYQVNAELREMMIFASHNVFADPPFQHLDLVSCRNLLIYLSQELQQQVVTLFHYALSAGGFLFTGTSESLGQAGFLFETVDRQARVYRRSGSSARSPLPVDAFRRRERPDGALGAPVSPTLPELVRSEIDRRYAPPLLVATLTGQVLYVQGEVEEYLTLQQGELGLDIGQLARQGLRLPLRSAIQQALSEEKTVVYRSVAYRVGDEHRRVRLVARPLPQTSKGDAAIVFFEPLAGDEEQPAATSGEIRLNGAAYSASELEAQSGLQHTVEQLEAAYVELQSYNEELQATNEELATAKEELRVINDELMGKNAELEEKTRQLTDLNDELHQALSAIDFGMLFLDLNLRIQRFNDVTKRYIKVREGDIGRSLADLRTNLVLNELTEDAERVLDTLETRSIETQTREGEPVLVRLTPSRTAENAINGVMLTFTDPPRSKDTG